MTGLFLATYFNLIEDIISLHKPYLFPASHYHTYKSILTNYSTQSIPWSEKQVSEITTASEVSGNRALGQQYCFLNTIDDFSVIVDDIVPAYFTETDEIILPVPAYQTSTSKDII